MFKTDIITRIEKTGAMAIVRTETIERGIEIAQGCLNGGVDVLEISYTLPNAGEVIEAINKKFKDQLVVGAGTVLDAETARLAILKGAKFIIAPNFSKEVARLCNRYQMAVPQLPKWLKRWKLVLPLSKLSQSLISMAQSLYRY